MPIGWVVIDSLREGTRHHREDATRLGLADDTGQVVHVLHQLVDAAKRDHHHRIGCRCDAAGSLFLRRSDWGGMNETRLATANAATASRCRTIRLEKPMFR